MSEYHIPVMLSEVLEFLDIKKDGWYIDCNLGGGGHTEGILKKGGKVLGIDLDQDAISEVFNKYTEEIKEKRLIVVQSNFSKIKEVVEENLKERPQGILFDLGVSSYQLETPKRGFSFNTDAPLDMRMDQTSDYVKASDLINGLHEKELTELFLKLGEENFAKPIARRIVQVREKERIETTNQLASIILSVRHRSSSDRTHPATRVFQALRIAVNDELNSLKEALPNALEVLRKDGKLLVISFHSLEDRIVKEFFNEQEKNGVIKILTEKPIEPTREEIDKNPRSRSGKLRVAVKII